MNGFKIPIPIAGIDVGSRVIKGVKLKKKGGRVIMDRYFTLDLSKDNSAYPIEKNLLTSLSGMIEIHKLKNIRVATSLSDDHVIAFEVKLPPIPENEVGAAIEHELQENYQLNLEEIYYDTVIVEQAASPQAGEFQDQYMIVMVYVAKRELVKNHIALLKGAKLNPISMESDMLAAIEALKFNEYIQGRQTQVIIDLGDSQTTVALVVDGNLRFSKTVKIGSGVINQELTRELRLSYDESEKMKLSYDFSSQTSSATGRDQAIIDDVYYKIFKEIKETIDQYYAHFQGHFKIDQILLIGGGSQRAQIDRVIEGFFKVPTIIPNPLKNIEIYSDAMSSRTDEIGSLSPYFTTAVGLALRGVA